MVASGLNADILNLKSIKNNINMDIKSLTIYKIEESLKHLFYSKVVRISKQKNEASAWQSSFYPLIGKPIMTYLLCNSCKTSYEF